MLKTGYCGSVMKCQIVNVAPLLLLLDTERITTCRWRGWEIRYHLCGRRWQSATHAWDSLTQ